ncbi:hypothetical protein [Marinobacter sp. SS5-14b]|uniref:hypothetical protein n=1 Tax=Marinobacter sp. SS5-14b TaxID=3050456 RepID=UPI0026DFB40E|nr:hypothetical protein [Marinobacter sp. SS5-14b]
MIHETNAHTSVSERQDLMSVVAVIRPSERPTVLPHGSLIEFESSDIANPKRQSFEIFLMDALNGFADITAPNTDLSVKSSSYLDPAASFGFPLFTAIFLKGEDVKDEQITRFREAVVVLAHEVLGQASLFHAEPEPALERREVDFLKEKAVKYREKYGSTTIKSGFYVHSSFEDLEGIAVTGKLPPLHHTAPIVEEIEGVGRLDGFSLSKNSLSLIPDNDADTSTRPLEFLCSHQGFFKTFAEAYLNGFRVRYRGYRQDNVGSRKVTLTLISLDVSPAGDLCGAFNLE